MSDIFQEVQEEYRREQMSKAWDKYRVPIVSAAAGLIVLVAAYQGWVFWHANQVEASSRQFEVANQMAGGPKAQDAPAAYAKLASEGWGGYPLVAKFQEAATRASAGDTKGAAALYDNLSASSDGGTLFSDYARLRAAILLVDTVPLAEIQKRLDPIASGESPWRVEAEEMLAYAYWRAGNKTEALRLLGLIKKNPAATSGVKQRATQFTAMIVGGMTVADIKAPPAPTILPGGPILPPGFDVPAPTPGGPAAPAPATAPPAPPSATAPAPATPTAPAPTPPAPPTPTH